MWWCILFVCMLLQDYIFNSSVQSRRIIIPSDPEYLPNTRLIEILKNKNFRLKKLNRDAEIVDVSQDFEPQEFLAAVRKSMFEPLINRYKDMETRRIMPGVVANWPPLSAYRRDKMMDSLNLRTIKKEKPETEVSGGSFLRDSISRGVTAAMTKPRPRFMLAIHKQ